MKTLSEVAGEHAALFEVKEFERDGEKFSRTIIRREPDYPATESALHKACVKLTFRVSEETSLDYDSCYDFTASALDAIAEANTDDEDVARERLNELEPDIYTADLTAWLAKSNDNVYYLDEALKQGEPDGFTALSLAQKLAMDEVGEIVLQYIIEARDEQDDDADGYATKPESEV